MPRPMRSLMAGWWRAERITQLGFLTILGGVLLLLILGYSGINAVRKEMRHALEVNGQKAAITQTLNHIVNQRLMLARSVIHMDDLFQRDELVQQYSHLAINFHQNIEMLKGLDQEAGEKADLENLQAYIRSAADVIAKIYALPTAPSHAETSTLSDRVMILNGKVHELLGQLQIQQRYDFQANIVRIRHRFAHNMLILISSFVLMLLIILYIAYWVSGYVKRSNRQLTALAMEKSMLLATMSHEIRTPLTSIIGFGETLLETDTTKEERIAGINAIVRNGRYLQGVINDVLDFSKLDAGQMELQNESTSLINCLDDMDNMLRGRSQSKGLTFNISTGSDGLPEHIETDPIKLRQILINLMGNAIKFTQQGEVRLEVSFHPQTSRVCFDVSDTGIGMDHEQLQNLFSPYRQVGRQHEGTGLGLYISRQMAKLMGGELSVQSEAGKGSCFSLCLPVGDVSTEQRISWQRKLPDVASPAASRAVRYSGKVLLVEDRKDNQKLFSIYLDKAGVDVDIVENGRQAVAAALEGNYALILMDVQMPEMDGITATRELRRHGYPGPIVALTANQSVEDRQRCKEAGYDDFLSKPISRADFVQTLGTYLSKKIVDDTEASTPIYCQVLLDEPDLQPAVDYFVGQLSELQRNLKRVLMDKDWPTLKELVHDLKGTAGGVGYPMLSEMAMKVEFALAKHDDEEVAYLSNLVANLIQRIEQGYTLQRHDTNFPGGEGH